MDEFKYIEYEVADHVGTITLARPDKANAQNERLLDELDHRFRTAEYDDDVRVIVLRARGKHFSAGHDLDTSDPEDSVQLQEPDGSWHYHKMYRWEARKYLNYSWNWRNIPKPTIGAIQGKAIAGALNLIWPLDLLVAADDMQISDPVVLMAIGGVEYHGHTWELGARRAKDMLFTQRPMFADEAHRIGLVREVVPRDELWARTQELAAEIAQHNAFGLAQAKRAVNQTLDVQGYFSALQSVFDIHSVGHGNAISVGGYPVLMKLDELKENLKDQ
ncbi:MAG: enoyl-CoA hydratase [Acidimicrobiia bacterium]|nr:enoyl-CoA hydratase [Acidimicrobiia bacterium]